MKRDIGDGRKWLERFVLQVENLTALAKAFSAGAAKVAFAQAARKAVVQGGYSRRWSVCFHVKDAYKRNIKEENVR